MAAGCTVTAMLLIARYATRPSSTLVLTIALLIVAGFESSTFVGGVTFALAAIIAAPLVFTAVDPPRRWRFVGGLAIAAVLVIVLIAPFVLDQFAAVRARGGGSPIVVSHYRVFGELLPHTLRRILDIPGYWLLILPAELPAAYVAGVIALVTILGAAMPRAEKLAAAMLGLSRRYRPRRLLAVGFDARPEQRSWAARDHSGGDGADRRRRRGCGRLAQRGAAPPGDRHRADRASAWRAGHRRDNSR